MQANWTPNNSCVLAGVPLAVPSKEQISKLYMLFYSMVGGFAKIVKSNYVCVNGRWEFCIPYEGNESLLGTTKDVEDRYD